MGEKVYLIANNCMLTEDHLESLNLNSENDLAVLFNYMYIPLDWFRKIRHKIAFLRVVYEEQHENNRHYLGGVEFKERQNDFIKLICVDDFGRYEEYTKDILIPCENLNVQQFLEETNFVYDNYIGTPTTGFLAYLYMKKLYPSKEIILVGFTGHYADGSIPDKLHHNYDWEQVYYTQNNIKRVYCLLDELK